MYLFFINYNITESLIFNVEIIENESLCKTNNYQSFFIIRINPRFLK